MRVAVVTFDGFNEIDSFVAAHIINRVRLPGWGAEITAPEPSVTSMNGVRVAAQQPLEFASEADAVILGSGRKTREVVADEALMSRLRLDPSRQYITSQCSGALILIRLGLLKEGPVCTDAKTRPAVEAAGFEVPEGAFHARGRIATAGGCLASHYLATWLIGRGAGWDAAAEALSYVLPRGEEEAYLARALEAVKPFGADPPAFAQGHSNQRMEQAART
ncbi:ThiJ/PfpI family protein [Minicystis rosea]|nr:ThiJ/PfpI family protein [Minicystis rosea]